MLKSMYKTYGETADKCLKNGQKSEHLKFLLSLNDLKNYEEDLLSKLRC